MAEKKQHKGKKLRTKSEEERMNIFNEIQSYQIKMLKEKKQWIVFENSTLLKIFSVVIFLCHASNLKNNFKMSKS